MVVVFGCDRSLKGVVGHGWVRCGLWVGVVVGQWWLWIGVGCGLWWLFLHLCSLLSTDPTPSLLSLPSLVVVFGCARSLKGVVGRGWVGCGLWVVGRRCCGSVVVVDRRGLWVVVAISPSLLSPLYGPNAISSLSSFSGCGFWL